MLHQHNIKYELVFTKTDLVTPKVIQEVLNIYKKEGIKCQTISFGNYQKKWNNQLKNVCVIGKSGVGKTTLINNLTNLNFKIGDISKKSRKGKHTTTSSYGIVSESFIIFDSPGFDKVLIDEYDKKVLAKYFFPKYLINKFHCQFTTCTHLNSDYCDLMNLVKNKTVDELRIKIYKEYFKQAKSTYW